MTMREQIITEALSWLNTPYTHYQRRRGAGVDCIQFIAGVCENVRLVEHIITPYYSPQWHLNQTEELLLNGMLSYGCTEKPLSALEPGDLLLFRFAVTQPCGHAAIYLPNGNMIHALAAPPAQVKIHRFAHEWKSKWFALCLSFPGVA